MLNNMYKYINIPKEISFNLIKGEKYCLAPSKYSDFYPRTDVDFRILTSITTHSTARTKVKKSSKYKYIEIGDIEVNTGFVDSNQNYGYFLPSENPLQIENQDILISTVRTYRKGIGIIEDNADNLVCTPAIYIIREVDNIISKEYLLAILRSDFFIEQILSLQNRGMYPRLDTGNDDKILIPIPHEKDLLKYVTVLSRAYINKQKLITEKNTEILRLVAEEISNNQKDNIFNYEYPNLNELISSGRIDAGFFSKDHKHSKFKIQNYSNGYCSLSKIGLQLIPGPSLEIKLLGTRIDSLIPQKGFYRVVTPKQFSKYGTISHYEYMGTPRKINPIQFGDILFGESGTGRSVVYLDKHSFTINNAHAHILRPIDGECSLEKAITVRSILAYYKSIGVIDHLTVGGSGGHLSPSYFDRVYIPNFPDEKQKEISKLYYNPTTPLYCDKLTLDNFLNNDNEFNKSAGITELDMTAKLIKNRLDKVIDHIVNNESVEINFNFMIV